MLSQTKPVIDLRAYSHDIDFSGDFIEGRSRFHYTDPYPPLATLLAVTEQPNGSWEARRESPGGGMSKRCATRKEAIEKLLEDLSVSYRFWDDKVAMRKAGDITPDGQPVIRSGATHYTIGPENTRYPVRGFAGRRFRFQLLDSEEIVESTNVWYQGRIPREFAKALPDNAIEYRVAPSISGMVR